MPKYKSVKSSSASNESQPLEIRKLQPGEPCRRTGNGATRYCIKVQGYTHPAFAVECRYHRVAESVLSAVADWVEPVLFHEMVSKTGERFAHPQVLSNDPLNPDTWKRLEQALFLEPINSWVAIDFSDDSDEYTLQAECLESEDPIPNPHFAQQLDAALAPYAINDVDHPMAMRLRMLLGDLADTHAHLVWDNIA